MKLFRFKKTWIALSIISIIATLAIASGEQDPMASDLDQLNHEADRVFFDAVAKADQGGNRMDKLLSLTDAGLRGLIERMEAFQKKFELRSFELANKPLADFKLQLLANVTRGYLQLEFRLYANYYRNAHAQIRHESEYVQNFYEKLDLKFSPKLAHAIFSTPDLQLDYNIRHLNTGNDTYNLATLAPLRHELDQLEQAVLLNHPTEESYAKFVLGSSIRERIINQWALQRIIPDRIGAPDLQSCGENLVAFRDQPNSIGHSYYEDVRQQDDYQDFLNIKEGLKPLTIQKPLVNAAELAQILRKFYKDYPADLVVKEYLSHEEVKIKQDLVKAAAAPEPATDELFSLDDETPSAPKLQEILDPNEFIVGNNQDSLLTPPSGSVPFYIPYVSGPTFLPPEDWGKNNSATSNYVEDIDSTAENFVSAIEEEWQTFIDASFLDAAYPADRWDEGDLAARIAWVAYKVRKEALIKTILTDSGGSNRGHLEKVQKNWDLAHQRVRALVEQVTDAKSDQGDFTRAEVYRAGIKRAVLAYLQSPEVAILKREIRNQRFESTYFELKRPLEIALGAIHAKESIEHQCNSAFFRWSKGHLVYSFDTNTQYELASLPIKGYFTSRAYLWNPQQLSALFSRKLEIYTQQDRTSEVKEVVQEITQNPIVMVTLHNFFEELTKAYSDSVAGKSPDSINAGNSPLFELAHALAKKHYAAVATFTTPGVGSIPNPDYEGPAPAKMRFMTVDEQQKRNENLRALNGPDYPLPPIVAPRPLPFNNDTVPTVVVEDDLKLDVEALNNIEYHDRGPYPEPKKFELKTSPTIDAPKKQKHSTAELFAQALGMMNLGQGVYPDWTMFMFNADLGNEKWKIAKSPLQIEAFLAHQTEIKPDQGREYLMMSALDHYIMGELIRQTVLGEHPILELNPNTELDGDSFAQKVGFSWGSKVDAPNILDKIAASPQDAHSLLFDGILKAAKRQYGLVEEACAARPFEPFNRRFKNIFESSTYVRNSLKKQSDAFVELDEKVRLDYARTKGQKLHDDILASWEFKLLCYIMMAAMAFAALNAVGAAIACYAASGSLFGAGGALQVLMMSVFSPAANYSILSGVSFSSLSGFFGLFMSFKHVVGWLALSFFMIQSMIGYNATFLTMPPQVKYLLRVSNTQIGIFSKKQIEKADVKSYADLVYSARIGDGVNTFMNFLPFIMHVRFVIPTGSIKTAMALSNLARGGGEEIAQTIRAKSMLQLIREEGSVSKALSKFFSEESLAYRSTGKHRVISPDAKPEAAGLLMVNKLMTFFKTYIGNGSLQDVQKLVVSYMAELNDEIYAMDTAYSKAGPLKNRVRALFLKMGFTKHYAEIYVSKAAHMELATAVFPKGLTEAEALSALGELAKSDKVEALKYWKAFLQNIEDLKGVKVKLPTNDGIPASRPLTDDEILATALTTGSLTRTSPYYKNMMLYLVKSYRRAAKGVIGPALDGSIAVFKESVDGFALNMVSEVPMTDVIDDIKRYNSIDGIIQSQKYFRSKRAGVDPSKVDPNDIDYVAVDISDYKWEAHRLLERPSADKKYMKDGETTWVDYAIVSDIDDVNLPKMNTEEKAAFDKNERRKVKNEKLKKKGKAPLRDYTPKGKAEFDAADEKTRKEQEVTPDPPKEEEVRQEQARQQQSDEQANPQ